MTTKTKLNLCSCGGYISDERAELGLSKCKRCAFASPEQPYRGVMQWGHKTAADIQVMSADVYNEHKKYYVAHKGRRSVMKQFFSRS